MTQSSSQHSLDWRNAALFWSRTHFSSSLISTFCRSSMHPVTNERVAENQLHVVVMGTLNVRSDWCTAGQNKTTTTNNNNKKAQEYEDVAVGRLFEHLSSYIAISFLCDGGLSCPAVEARTLASYFGHQILRVRRLLVVSRLTTSCHARQQHAREIAHLHGDHEDMACESGKLVKICMCIAEGLPGNLYLVACL